MPAKSNSSAELKPQQRSFGPANKKKIIFFSVRVGAASVCVRAACIYMRECERESAAQCVLMCVSSACVRTVTRWLEGKQRKLQKRTT